MGYEEENGQPTRTERGRENRCMLKKQYRIHLEKQYRRVFQAGKKYVGRYMVLIAETHPLSVPRVGIITSKKVGKAHERNRAKRQLRACVRENFAHIAAADVVLIARTGIKSARYTQISKDFQILLKKGRFYQA